MSAVIRSAIVTGLITMVIGILGSYLSRRLATIHQAINSQYETVIARVSQLENALKDAGKAVPPTPPKED